MNPLAQSFANGSIERELQALMIQLYDESLKDTADEINLYGAPHLGPLRLIQRSIAQDGLSVLSQATESGLRYLFKAWRFQNPRRGTHFLETYLRVLFGDVYEINQLWQKKSEPYPSDLRTREEIALNGESESDYFLTSRLRVDLTTDEVPERVIRALRTVVAARLVLEVRISQSARSDFGVGGVMSLVNFFQASGESLAPAS